MRSVLKYISKALSAVLVALILLGTAVPAWGDTRISEANNRTAQFIKLVFNDGKSAHINLKELSKKDARFIGIYLTNFLVPYATAINGDDDVAKTIKENMKKHLVNVLGISEADSIALADWAFAEMQSSNQDLRWKFAKEGNAETGSGMLEPPKEFIPVTHHELQKIIAGEFMHDKSIFCVASGDIATKVGDERMAAFKKYLFKDSAGVEISGGELGRCGGSLQGEGRTFVEKVINEDYRYAYLVDNNDNIMFSVDISGGVMTPSVAALMQAVSVADPSQGYGTNFFDMSADKLESIISEAEDKGTALTKEDSVLMSKLTADSFGSIHMKGKNTDTIILPGSANPYTWKLKDNKGGQGVALQNSLFMGASTQGGIASPTGLGSAVSQCTFPTVNAEEARKKLEGGAFGIDVSYTYALGSSEKDFSSNRFIMFWTNNDEGSNASNILKDYVENTKSYYTYMEGQDGTRGSLPTYFFGGRVGQPARFGTQAVPCGGRVIIYDKDALSQSSAVTGAGGSGEVTPKAGATQGTADEEEDKSESTSEDVQSTGAKTVEGFTSIQALQADGTINAGGDAGNFQAKADLFNEGMSVAGSDKKLKGIADTGKVFDEYTALSVYFIYLVAMLGDDAGKDAIGVSINADGSGNVRLPAISDTSSFELSEDAQKANEEALKTQMEDDITQAIWNLLNPQKTEFASQLISNKTSAFILDAHNKTIGVTKSKVVSGTTQYTGIAGYLSTPSLQDVSFTSAIYDTYYKNFVYVVVAIFLFMLLYWVFGQVTWQQAVAGFGVLSLLSFLSFKVLDTSINVSNSITDTIYSDKVLYWAMYQNQAYSEEINAAATSENYEDYLATQYSKLGAIDINGGEDETGNTIGTGSIMLKWQAGKKLNSLVVGNGTLDKSIAGIDSVWAKQGIASLESTISGQSFLDRDSTYLYRSYIDANNFSRYMYSGFKQGIASYDKEPGTADWVAPLAESWGQRDATRTSTKEFGYNLETDTNLRYEPFMSSRIVDNALRRNSMEGLTQSSKDDLGIDTRYFNFGIPNFTQNSDILGTVDTNVKARAEKSRDNASESGFSLTGGDAGYREEDYYGLGVHAIYSESPFYYLSWNYYDQGLKATAGTDGYKDLLLGTANENYFYNTEGNGGMRDYNDMRSLFTYVIPRLNQGNEIVREFDRTYGLKYEVGVPATEGHWGDEGIADNPERAQKYWKNLQIARLYGIYSPWVDQLYATKYAESQVVKYQGKDVLITNPLDPSTYPADRPMIFSESEMMDYGLEEGQLTTVESKILKVQRAQMDNMIDMLNYYNFEDSVLNTAVAMQGTFEFNKEFSDQRLFGESINLYPQAFEQKNFSWDVYLRMYLAGNSVESITGSTGTQFYANLVASQGLGLAVLLLVADWVSGEAYPLMRMAVIWLAALSMLFHIFLMAVQSRSPKEAASGFFRGILLPLVAIFSVSIGYAWLFSLMLESGSNMVTGDTRGLNFSFESPTWALLFLIAINLAILRLLWAVAVSTFASAKSVLTASIASVAGLASAGGNILSQVSQGTPYSQARANQQAGGTAGANASANSSASANVSAGGKPALGGSEDKKESNEEVAGKEVDYSKEDKFGAFGARKPEDSKPTSEDNKLEKDIEEKSKEPAEEEGTDTPPPGTAPSRDGDDEPTKPLEGLDDITKPLEAPKSGKVDAEKVDLTGAGVDVTKRLDNLQDKLRQRQPLSGAQIRERLKEGGK